MLGCRSLGVWLLMKILLGSQAQGDQQASNQSEKMLDCKSSGVWLLIKLLLGSQAQGDQQSSSQIEKCWAAGLLVSFFD